MDEQPADIDGAELEVLRGGVRLMALRAFGDGDLADEIAQETLVRAFHSLRTSRPERMGPFVAGIARHVIADVIRKRSRPAHLEELAPDAHPSVTPDPIADLCLAEEKARILEALDEISEDDKALLHLVYFQDHSPVEIARRLGLTPESIRQRKLRALARLRRAFNEVPLRVAEGHETRSGPTVSGDLRGDRKPLETT